MTHRDKTSDRGCPYCRRAARRRGSRSAEYSEFIRFMMPSVYFINPKKELVYSGSVFVKRPKIIGLGRIEMLMIDTRFHWQLACCLFRELSRSESFRRIFVCWIHREVMYSNDYKDNAGRGCLVPEQMKKETNYIEIKFSRPRPEGKQADKNLIPSSILSHITLNRATFLSTKVKCIVPEKKWACLLLPLVVQKLNLEYVMACLSTLGGAHSSLGENSQLHAKLAGIMSVKQLAIAAKLNDPVLASHCRIYYAHSLIQTGKWKAASKVIRREYKWAVSTNGRSDSKLITCCRAAWARVLYFKKQKKLISHEAMRNE